MNWESDTIDISQKVIFMKTATRYFLYSLIIAGIYIYVPWVAFLIVLVQLFSFFYSDLDSMSRKIVAEHRIVKAKRTKNSAILNSIWVFSLYATLIVAVGYTGDYHLLFTLSETIFAILYGLVCTGLVINHARSYIVIHKAHSIIKRDTLTI